MNMLIPDSWLRKFLKTKATPEQMKEYLSLTGPSVERMHREKGDMIYDIEITTNRPDSMSVLGIAREAAAILPRFGIKAELINDPYEEKARPFQAKTSRPLFISTDPSLNPRWTSVVIDNVKIGPSPAWLTQWLELTGIRSLNNVIDITNYLMRAYGQPAHAFDYDQIHIKNGIPTMILRASKKGEKLTTLDGKLYTLPGDDIVIEDGSGRLIDLCGIMGGLNSSIQTTTKTIILFMQTYNPFNIRRTSMSLAHRTEAASLFEKGLDPELVLPSVIKGITLAKELAGGDQASKIFDLYPKPFRPYKTTVSKKKLFTYIGEVLPDKDIAQILSPLGFTPKLTETEVTVTVPSFRRDITIDVDIIEEIARMYGYHNLKTKLPDTEPPVVTPDKTFTWEEEIKIRLRDWGYTETYTYSMISGELMDIFGLDKKKAYKIINPLSNEWIYMRPHVFPSILENIRQNLRIRNEFKIFELSMAYRYRSGNLPFEIPTLVVAWTGNKFPEAKGLAESLFKLFGIEFPDQTQRNGIAPLWYGPNHLSLNDFGSLGLVANDILTKMGIHVPVTRLYLDLNKIVPLAKTLKKYTPIPKYPSSFEDIALIIPPNTNIGPIMETIRKSDPLITDVSLLDAYENIRTFHITYRCTDKNLTDEDIRPIREKLLTLVGQKYAAKLKAV